MRPNKSSGSGGEREKEMRRELETEEEVASDLRPFSGLKKPYQAALNGDWEAMRNFYDMYPERVVCPLTIDGLTAFHIAGYSERTEPLQHLLGLLKPHEISAAVSKKSDHGNNVFHEVASTNNVKSAKLLIKTLLAAHGQRTLSGNNLPELRDILEDRNQLGETPLFRAAALGQKQMAKFLAELVGDITHHFQRNDTMSILHTAVLGQHFETAIWLLGKDKTLGTRKEINDMTCLHLLAQMPSAFRSSCNMSKMQRLLYHCLPCHLDVDNDDEDNSDDDDDGNEVQTPSSHREDLESQNSKTLLQSNPQYSSGISRVYYAVWKGLAQEWPGINEVWTMKRKHVSALKLTKLLAKMDTSWANSSKVEDKPISLGKGDFLNNNVRESGVKGRRGEMKRSNTAVESEELGEEGANKGQPSGENRTPYTPLLIAASEGIVEIFDEILDVYPQALEHLSKDDESIVHMAISHRQREIFRRVKMMKRIMKHRLFSMIDKRGYTILHHVADMRNYNGGTQAGPALQLQEELQWFERVRKLVPSHYEVHRNNDGKTADELFKEQHAKLLEKAERWIKETSQSCSAVAVLVATVVFTAAFTVPGGTDSKGHPVFFNSPFFLFFTIMDVVSLASSLTYVVMFLSILTSPFKQENFFKSLPRKLMIGFTLLFLSMTTTMLSFAATILLINHSEKRSLSVTLINTAILLPVSVFALMQFPLYFALTNIMISLLKKIKKKVTPRYFFPRFFKTHKRKTYCDLT